MLKFTVELDEEQVIAVQRLISLEVTAYHNWIVTAVEAGKSWTGRSAEVMVEDLRMHEQIARTLRQQVREQRDVSKQTRAEQAAVELSRDK